MVSNGFQLFSFGLFESTEDLRDAVRDIIPLLLSLVDSLDSEIRKNAAWTLKQLAEYRE